MDYQRLGKVLALAASDNEAEALHALRTAQRLLEAGGLDFVSLGGTLAGAALPAPDQSAALEEMEDALFDLRSELRHLRAENDRLRQGAASPATAAPPAPPGGGSFAETAEAVHAAIRLRSEIASLAEALQAEQAESLRLRCAHAGLARTLEAAQAEIARLSARTAEMEQHRLRLEAEAQSFKAAKPPKRPPAKGKAGQYALF